MKHKTIYPVCHRCRRRARGRYKKGDVWECLRCGNIYSKSKEWYVNGGIEIEKIPASQRNGGLAVNGKPKKKLKKAG